MKRKGKPALDAIKRKVGAPTIKEPRMTFTSRISISNRWRLDQYHLTKKFSIADALNSALEVYLDIEGVPQYRPSDEKGVEL